MKTVKQKQPPGPRLTLKGGSALFAAGQVVTGRWERKSYHIVQALGQGGMGKVYLVRSEAGELLAMKVSTDLTGITHEHRMLVYLNQRVCAQELKAVPRVYELDDFQVGTTVYHYIITQFCPGRSLVHYLGRLRTAEVASIGKQVADCIGVMHRLGLVFGDLKPTNILYNRKTRSAYIIDYGSVSVKGHTLKQYTPGYDRTSWHAGSRIADENFDIFSTGVLLSAMLLGKVQKKGGGHLEQLMARISTQVAHHKLRNIIIKSLKQEASDCQEIARVLLDIVAEGEQANIDRSSQAFVSIVGATSVVAFILSLAYYYQ